jgi:ribonuclease T1
MASAMRLAWRRVPLQQLAWIVLAVTVSAFALARGGVPQPDEIRLHDLPPEARHTLQLIQRGGPYPHERDGIIFGNYEKLLPAAQRGHYSEYTVTTPGVRHRGARRIVVGCERQRPVQPPSSLLRLAHCRNGGELYYTADHYRSFRRIVE